MGVDVKARNVRVKGKRGTLTRSFKHAQVEMKKSGKTIEVAVWHGKRAELAKLRLVYAHFPINGSVSDNKDKIEVRNFIGQKHVRSIKMNPGVTVDFSKDVKDEIVVTGNSIEDVSLGAAMIQQSTTVHNKDIRKFLDGVYVSESGPGEEA